MPSEDTLRSSSQICGLPRAACTTSTRWELSSVAVRIRCRSREADGTAKRFSPTCHHKGHMWLCEVHQKWVTRDQSCIGCDAAERRVLGFRSHPKCNTPDHLCILPGSNTALFRASLELHVMDRCHYLRAAERNASNTGWAPGRPDQNTCTGLLTANSETNTMELYSRKS